MKRDPFVGQILSAHCSGLSYLGLGEVHFQDKAVYVPDFYPEEEGLIKVSYKRNGQYFGEVVSLTKRSPDRIESKCPYFGECGGCIFQDYSYQKELEHKQKLIKNQLYKIGGIDVDVLPTIGMSFQERYRNKIQLHFAKDKNNDTLLGFYEKNSHHVIPIEDCLIQDQRGTPIAKAILEAAKEFHIPVYDENTQEGELRHLLIRTSFYKQQILVVLVTKDAIFPEKNSFIKKIKASCPDITTLVQSINKKPDNVILGNKELVLYGPGFIYDVLCGLTFKISARSFYQTNPKMTEILYQKAMEFASLSGNEVVLDAYSGIGTIGLCASKNASKVFSVELVRSAVEDAKENARINHIINFKEYQDDATHFIIEMAKRGDPLDVLFMDPPRKGSTKEFLNAVKLLQPKRIIYVSCGPSSLARDLRELANLYSIEVVQPVDLFPRTSHVEMVVLLVKREGTQ